MPSEYGATGCFGREGNLQQDTEITVRYVHHLRAVNAALLEALEDTLEFIRTRWTSSYSMPEGTLARARAAIRQAKGGDNV